MISKLKELSPLAPLHNPPAVQGIEVARKLLPDVPHIAVFDTAFFHHLPAAAATYAIDRELAQKHGRSAGTDFTAPHTNTSASRRRPSWAGRWTA